MPSIGLSEPQSRSRWPARSLYDPELVGAISLPEFARAIDTPEQIARVALYAVGRGLRQTYSRSEYAHTQEDITARFDALQAAIDYLRPRIVVT